MEEITPTSYCAPRRFTDDLDDAVLDYVLHMGEASVRRIATEIEKPYSTVMVRCLKLEAAGFLHSMWYGNVRRFRVVKQEGCENVRRHSIEKERPVCQNLNNEL